MARIKTRYKCRNCGYVSASYLGRCPNCGAWSQFEEETQEVKKVPTKATTSRLMTKAGNDDPIKSSEVKAEEEKRIVTPFEELNRVLGGGIVPGFLVLIGGDPGIGKSTLMLRIADALAKKHSVLYVSGEGSASQIKMRADRLGVSNSGILLCPETNMQSIREQIDEIKPDFLMIDSIRTMSEPSLDSIVGSASQVREVTSELIRTAKNDQITTFVIGHMTKEDAITGPKTMEHMVDTILYSEGDGHHSYRILRSVKNRFRAANEIGMFEMKSEGLIEVNNPSTIFLDRRLPNPTGSVVAVSLGGTRPLLADIQALVTPTVSGYAKGTTSGLDLSRVALLLTVLEKRGNLMLQSQGAFLTATDGVKLNEPAIDLAICVVVASSYKNKEISATDCFVGEVGLTGEIRRANQIEARVRKVVRVGSERIFIPKHNLTTELKSNSAIEAIGVTNLPQALRLIFNRKID